MDRVPRPRRARPLREPPPPFEVMNATLAREPSTRRGGSSNRSGTACVRSPSARTRPSSMSRNKRDITYDLSGVGRANERLLASTRWLTARSSRSTSGRPSFEKLQSRINLQNPRDIERAMGSLPVTYIAFDLLVPGRRVLARRPTRGTQGGCSKTIVSPRWTHAGIDLVETERRGSAGSGETATPRGDRGEEARQPLPPREAVETGRRSKSSTKWTS